MMDLAAYLQSEVDKTSIRKVAKLTMVSKTTIDNIINRRIKTMPELQTLEKIASAYGLTLPAVVEMAGAVLGDGDLYAQVARQLEQLPWIKKRFNELTSLDEQEFNYWLDWVKWRRGQGEPPDSTPLPPTG